MECKSKKRKRGEDYWTSLGRIKRRRGGQIEEERRRSQREKETKERTIKPVWQKR